MRHVASTRTFVEVAMIGVHVTARRAILIGSLHIIEKLRECVMSKERQARAHSLFGADETAVICGIANRRVDPGDIVKLWKRAYQLGITRSHELGRHLIQT